jgi:hypothetical protein
MEHVPQLPVDDRKKIKRRFHILVEVASNF